MHMPRCLFALTAAFLMTGNAYSAKPQISGGESHAIVLKSSGTVLAWGNNTDGQIGDGSTTKRATPTAVSGLTNVVAVAAGKAHNLAVKADGTVWAWGNNGLNQLGDGSSTNRSTPVQVSGLSGATAVSAGDFFSMALKSDGTVWAWGDNGSGQLGDGTSQQRSTPVQVSGLSGITAIAAGYYYAVALKSDGTVWTWGINDNSQLGDGTTTNRSTARQVNGVSGVTAIAAAFGHVSALKSDGTLLAWGRNNHGQLSDGKVLYAPAQEFRTTVEAMQQLSGITAVAAGLYHTVTLSSAGTMKAVGGNIHGQLGNGATQAEDREFPVDVADLSKVGAIGVGRFESFAVTTEGWVYGFGKNDQGQLGDGTTTNRSRATPVLDSSGSGALNVGLFCSSACPVLAVSGSSRKTVGDLLTVKLALSGLAGQTVDVYTAVQLPDSTLLFMTAPQMFGSLSFTAAANPYQAGVVASDVEGALFNGLALTSTLPKGTYKVYAVAVGSGKFPMQASNWIGGLASAEFVLQ